MSNKQNTREEDLFSHTRMDLGSHIEELRDCLWRAMKWFFIAMIVGIFVAKPVLNFINEPIERELLAFHEARVESKLKQLEGGRQDLVNANQAQPVKMTFPVETLAKRFGIVAPPGEETVEIPVVIQPSALFRVVNKFNMLIARPPTLRALTVLEGFIVWLKVSMYCGFILAAPMIFREVWGFVAAGLYPEEKALVYRAMPLSIGLFLAGVALCQFVILPIGIHYLLGFNAWLDIEPELRLTDWLSFAIFTPLVFGIAFQTPLLMFVLNRVGILSVEMYIQHWRIATFVIILMSGLLAPSPDPISMLSMGIPICCLYWFGILLCKWWPRPKVDLDIKEPEEAVEV